MSEATICFPIETKVREFDGKLLLSSYLLSAGFDVVIGSRKRIKEYVLLHDRCVYVPKSITLAEFSFYEELRESGNAIVLMHVEGGILYKNADEGILYSYPQPLLPLLDRICVFGEAIRSHIVRLRDVDPLRIVVTGEPRFDLLKPRYAGLLRNRAKDILEQRKEYLLVNTSFGLSNHVISQSYVQDLIKNNPDFSDRLKRNLLQKQAEFAVLVQCFSDLTAAIAIAFPEYKVVLRPHPEENVEYYRNRLEDIPNIEVNHEGNVAYWIAGAKAIVHYDCTTGVEAWIKGKPVVSFAPHKNEELVAWLPLLVSHECATQEAVLAALREAIAGKIGPKLIGAAADQLVAEHIHNMRAESGPIFLDCIRDVVKERFSRTMPAGWPRRMERRRLIGKNLLRDVYRKYVRPASMTTESYKVGTIGPVEVRSTLCELSAIHGFKCAHKVRSLGENLVHIRAEK